MTPTHTRRPKQSKVYLFAVKVEGCGHFPVDMLRYDGCYPASERDSALTDNSTHQGRRVVSLRMVDYNPGGPTAARWESFTWKVVEVEPINADLI